MTRPVEPPVLRVPERRADLRVILEVAVAVAKRRKVTRLPVVKPEQEAA
jgi:hypothetical protein